jgi:hypothetical protein
VSRPKTHLQGSTVKDCERRHRYTTLVFTKSGRWIYGICHPCTENSQSLDSTKICHWDTGSRSTAGVDQRKTIPYISNDKFSQEGSFTIGIVVCQGTLKSTKRTLMLLGCGGWPESGFGIEWVFISDGKQHDDLKKNTIIPGTRPWKSQWLLKSSINTKLPTGEDKGSYGDRRLVGGRVWRMWFWYGLNQWF